MMMVPGQQVVMQQPMMQVVQTTTTVQQQNPASQGDPRYQPISDANQILIKHEGSCMGCCSLGFCAPDNEYKVYEWSGDDDEGHEGKLLFTIEQESDCIPCRCLISTKKRGYKTNLKFPDTEVTAFQKKEFNLGCLCLCRPETDIWDLNEGRELKLGTLSNPCSMCCLDFKVTEEGKEDPSWSIDVPCCAYGVMCPFYCGPCSHADIPINNNNGNEVGQIVKKWQSCVSEYCQGAQDYIVKFPPNATRQQKFLLIFAATFIDMTLFEKIFPSQVACV